MVGPSGDERVQPARESGVRPRFELEAALASRARLGGNDLVAEITGSLLEGGDWRGVLASIVHAVARRLGVGCAVEIACDEGTHRCVEGDGIDAAVLARVVGPVAAAARERGAPVATSNADAIAVRAARRLGVASLTCGPLHGRGGDVMGTLVIFASGGPCTLPLDGIERLGARIALAVERARAHDDALVNALRSQQLLAAVAHDIKNPLGVVMLSAARVLAEPHATDAERAHHVDTILRATRRVGRLVGDLLNFAALENGTLSMQRASCDVGALVEEALREIAPLANESRIRLASEVSSDLPRAFCDADRIHQVLSNLLGNALKFTPHGGLVTVRAERRGAVVAVAVADSGLGIARRHLPRLFDRFWRAPGTSQEGCGLGLAICKSIVELGGGRIDVESALGAGTTVTFTIPVAERVA